MTETKRCSGCHKELPRTEFYRNRSSPDGLQAYCKVCGKAKTKQYQKEKPELFREMSRRSWARCREKRIAGDEIRMNTRRTFLNELKTNCAKCGESRRYLIEFHHIDPSKKEFTLGDGTKLHKSIEDVRKEAEKCVCLCANCHKEFHHFYGVKLKHPVEDLTDYLEREITNEHTISGVCSDLSETGNNAI